MTLTLGSAPQQLTVVLIRDADFVAVLHNSAGDWDAGVSIELRFGDTVWVATLAGADATFNVDKAAVNALVATKPRTARLFYVDGDVDLCWATGSASIRG